MAYMIHVRLKRWQYQIYLNLIFKDLYNFLIYIYIKYIYKCNNSSIFPRKKNLGWDR